MATKVRTELGRRGLARGADLGQSGGGKVRSRNDRLPLFLMGHATGTLDGTEKPGV